MKHNQTSQPATYAIQQTHVLAKFSTKVSQEKTMTNAGVTMGGDGWAKCILI